MARISNGSFLRNLYSLLKQESADNLLLLLNKKLLAEIFGPVDNFLYPKFALISCYVPR